MKDPRKWAAPAGEPELKVKKKLKPVKKDEESNVEGEKNEVLVTSLSSMNLPELYVLDGKPHSQGGTPLNIPDDSFFFSKDKSMRITNPEILESFDKKPKKIGYDPAEIAKQYDINHYLKTLIDPDADKLQKDTAEKMINNYTMKLGKLALVQESMKGMKDVPKIALPYLQDNKISPEQLVLGSGQGNDVVVDTMKKVGGAMKIKITAVPSYGGGGNKGKSKPAPKPKSMWDAAPKDFVDSLSEANVDVQPSQFASQAGMIPDTQQQLPNNIYGNRDWSSAEFFPEFRNRHSWYFDQNPNFDPRNKGDVEAFQKAYDERNTALGVKPYFRKNGKETYDGKFGEQTFLAPGLSQRKQADSNIPEMEVPTSNKRAPVDVLDMQYPAQADAKGQYWTQDLVNLFGATGDFSRIQNYMPWMAQPETFLPSATYYDPTRELGANAEQAAIAGQGLARFVGPQAYNSRMSEVQGHALANAANIMGRYNDLNVGVANQNEMNRVAILNQASLNRANRATELYDRTVASNQAFNNAQAQARQNIRQSYNTALTNRGQTQALNSINKQYQVDPRTGYVRHTGVPGNLTPEQPQNDFTSVFTTLIKSNPALANDPGKLADVALEILGFKGKRDNTGIPYNMYRD